MKNRLSVIVAGGGTGGHIFPAIAIANALRQLHPDTDILFVGAKGKMEMEKVPQAGYPIEGLTIAGFNRSSLIKNIGLPAKLIKSFLQVAGIFKRNQPDAVIGVGGYSSFPVLRYAQWKGIPTFIHEANSFGGKSNILLSKKATAVFTATDGMEKFFPAHKIVVTGNPVRQNITQSGISKEEACQFFGLNPHKKTVLCVGGSLGARSINEALQQHVKQLIQQDIQLIWQTGKSFAAPDKIDQSSGIYRSEFITQMDMAYAAADVVVSRSGAMALAELCVVKKPSILVPYPFAAEDHQTANAMNLVQKNAAVLVKDQDAMNQLVPAILNLVQDEQKQATLRSEIAKLAVTDADTIVAKAILKEILKK
ncbi:MAG TPA: undecaprenyldiphospho-muramoylpentapeptide beta-N-acetylglucosaminyltransferase [Ferruginibacter sp.]|nr:undecaprenyldiphospho-muramoylpentapeptide beta-N-acetylglucosaminyltransferase [Ferruginibacter sp.]HRO05109.1 undecaprenyldiphospho-muramoylpentapeptide beta-N-acetylglucosaminyltransferase [Ferruginibacter sp.]HRO95586.1 undecaprenyldiphospho-muramoylpentapeptide beta-N-acetylglucosaminyltransferase [Ferruginibacter sp.]HRP49555.1 undecaprenyldiphospho-muramoylpentapeptide beta-N-acetylglucosaminyltransferase [Ferruginibacter sp.]